MNPGHIYILGSDSGTLYMGVTSDLALHWETERLPPNRSLQEARKSSVEKQEGSEPGLKPSGSFDSGGDAAYAQDDVPFGSGSKI